MSPAKPNGAIDLAPGVSVDPAEVRFTFTRSSGPGGQAVNKLATKAELRVSVTSIAGLSESAQERLRRQAGQRLNQADELVIHADTHRSQLDNKRACLDRLRALVAAAVKEPRRRKKTRPSRAKIEKRLDEKRRRGEKKETRRNVEPGAEA